MEFDPTYQNISDFDFKEVQKLREFLEKARLSKYLQPLVSNGVTKVKDCQDYVKDDFLIQLHMSQPERERFWKYVIKSRPIGFYFKVQLFV